MARRPCGRGASWHQAFADGIHAADADAPVLFEPISTRNELDQATVTSTPWTSGPGVYAVHIYTGIFSTTAWSAQDEDAAILAPSMPTRTSSGPPGTRRCS